MKHHQNRCGLKSRLKQSHSHVDHSPEVFSMSCPKHSHLDKHCRRVVAHTHVVVSQNHPGNCAVDSLVCSCCSSFCSDDCHFHSSPPQTDLCCDHVTIGRWLWAVS